MFGDVDVKVTIVFAPDHSARIAAARRVLIAADATADVEVITGRQVFRRRASLVVHHEQIGLRVRLLRLVSLHAAERDVFAVVAECVIAHPAIEAQHLFLIATIERHRIEISVWRFVIRLKRAM